MALFRKKNESIETQEKQVGININPFNATTGEVLPVTADVIGLAINEAIQFAANSAPLHIPAFCFGAFADANVLKNSVNSGKSQPYKDFLKIEMGRNTIDIFLYPTGRIWKFELYTHPDTTISFTVKAQKRNEGEPFILKSVSVNFN